MKRSVAFLAAMICLVAVSCTSSQSDCSDFGLKPRIVVLTDIARVISSLTTWSP